MNLRVVNPGQSDGVDWVLSCLDRSIPAGRERVEAVNRLLDLYMAQVGHPVSLNTQRAILAEVLRRVEAPDEADAAPRAAPVPSPVAPKAASAPSDRIHVLGHDILGTISGRVDFATIALQNADKQRGRIQHVVEETIAERRLELNSEERQGLVEMVLDEMLGLGPLEPLLADPGITDIMVNGPETVYFERDGKIERSAARFRDADHVRNIAVRIAGEVGRRIDESSPIVDARLRDGSRVNITIPPLALDGPTITIRRFPARPLNLGMLVQNGSLTQKMADFLRLAVKLRLNILISGGTGSGKTSLLNAMSQEIPHGERILTIEDAAELQLQSPHVVRFESRPPNVEGKGEVPIRALVKNALRMRPDRIIIGEVRGDEVLDLLQAMNTGHDGSMCTLHANTPRDALTRVENMVALSGVAIPPDTVRGQLRDAVHLVIQVARMRDGRRRVTSIAEVVGMSGSMVSLQDIFTFKYGEKNAAASVEGRFEFSGVRPNFTQRAFEFGLAQDLEDLMRR